MTLTVFSESDTPLVRPRAATRSRMLVPPVQPAPLPLPKAPALAPTPAAVSAPPALPRQSSGPVRPSIVTRLSAGASAATGAVVAKHPRGDTTFVTIAGRLTESFKGEALGRELRGTVVIDLAGVERITSFGVREWLAMLGAAQDVRKLFFLRASEPVVNQLGMIRKFAGNAQIVSFFAPYLCGGCGEGFDRMFDCERDADAIREGRAEEAPCPNCGAAGYFDDDARSYFGFAASHLLTPVPAEIRAIADELSAQPTSAPREGIDKSVEGDVTRVRVQSKLGGAVRWKRVLDGIEGSLAIDLGAITGVDAAGIANLEQAILGVGPEVTSIVIERCPAMMVERFAQTGLPPRVSVTSAMLEARCGACAVPRTAQVSLQEHGDALAQSILPRVHCKRCNGELGLVYPARALSFLQSQLAPRSRPSMTVASLGAMTLSEPPIAPTAPIPMLLPRPPRSRQLPLAAAAGALGLALVVLQAMQLSRPSAPAAAAPPAVASAPPPPTPAPSTAWMQTVDLPPAWVERPFVIDAADVFIVGKGELAVTPELAMASARNDAVVRLVRQLHQDLAGSAVAEFLQARVHEIDRAATVAIAARYLKQFGATASPERTEAALRKQEAGVEGFARYRLSKSAYQQVLATYRDTTTLAQGVTVGRFFPLLETTLHTDGELVVLGAARGRPAAELGVRPGDVVLSVGAHGVASVDALARVVNEEWAQTPARGAMSMELESAGARRVIRFYKPAPN